MTEKVARPNKGMIFQYSFSLQLGKSRQRRRRVVREIGEHQSQVFFSRITPDMDFGGKARILGGLFHALTRTVIFPAVIEATDAVAFYPPYRELRSPVGAAVCQ